MKLARFTRGIAALAIGLVDELGSLQDAINYAVKTAVLTDPKIIYYPLIKEDKFAFLIELIKEVAEESEMKINSTGLPAELVSYYNEIKKIENRMGIQMRLPFDIKFD